MHAPTPSSSSGDGLSRRAVLTRAGQGGLGLALSGSLGLLFGGPSTAVAKGKGVGYGALVADPKGILSLPEGFSYELLAKSGSTLLETGQPVPAACDGMACFVRRGGRGSVLVLNHEVGRTNSGAVPRLEGLTYDPEAGGGCTTIEVDGSGKVVRHYVSLAGTMTNCAGGRTPWSTWLTCEENDSIINGVRHGYVFEVDPYDEAANRDPKPIKALGRFAHESVAVDPETGAIYQTEDAGSPNGLFYRWTPPSDALPLAKGSLRALADDAGQLDAMRATTLDGAFVGDLSPARTIGTTYRVEWQSVPDRDATTVKLRNQAYAQPVTRARKLEGMWWGDGGAYVVCSFARASDGSAGVHDGQVWRYDPADQTIELQVHFEYTEDQDVDPDGPDNITVSPYGGVIVAEDGDGDSHLVGTTKAGETFFLAKNQIGDGEFAGPTFSQDRKTLFVNVQSPGHVFAVRGPWVKQ